MPGPLATIVSLQKTKTDLSDAEARLQGIPDWMRELHEEHSAQRHDIEALESTRDEAAKTRRTTEAELVDAQEKLKRFQSQISQVTTQREYTALLKEIDTVKSLISELEKKVLEAIESHDRTDAELASRRESFRELDERYSTELAKWESEKPAVAARVAELRQLQAELSEKLPRPVWMLFERIYDRHDGQAAARIVRLATARGTNTMWHCEACSYNVRPQVVVEIRTGGTITQCDGCKRFLYLEEEDGE